MADLEDQLQHCVDKDDMHRRIDEIDNSDETVALLVTLDRKTNTVNYAFTGFYHTYELLGIFEFMKVTLAAGWISRNGEGGDECAS